MDKIFNTRTRVSWFSASETILGRQLVVSLFVALTKYLRNFSTRSERNERLPCVAQLPPAHLAPLKLHGVGAALLLDRAEGDASNRRLAKEDNKKDAQRLALEEPHTTAALLSLAGVHNVVFNQWAATAADNREMLGATLENLGGGGTLADALGAARAGLVIHPPPPPGEEGSQPPTEDGSRPGTAASKGSKGSKKGSPTKKSPRGKKGKESPREVVVKPTVWGVSANAVVYGVPQAFTLS